MYIDKTLKSGVGAAIIVRRSTEERLQMKCFRGSLAFAGNFLRWNSADELFRDGEVMQHFLAELDEMWSKQDFATHSVNIVCSVPLGWESSASCEDYSKNDLEQFNLNRRSWGLRVKLSQKNLLAPRTSELTVVYEFKSEDGKAVAIVHSIYPGSDVGELNGDVTEREKRVFFDWNHPGG